jgi:hypothetical protein
VDCIRVWGSPDIERDVHLEVKFPKKKPQKWVMHKVTDQSQTRPAARHEPAQEQQQEPEPEAAPAPAPAPAKFKFSPRGKELLNQMAATTSVDLLGAFPIAINAEADMTDDEKGRLLQLVEKRRAQLHEKAQQVASDDIPY